MSKNLIYVLSLFLVTSCSYLTGPEGYFPTTEHDFLEEVVETDIVIPSAGDDADTVLDFSPQAGCQTAITTIQAAYDKVAKNRAQLGAVQAHME